MLPANHKLTSPVQFRRVIKRGKRAGSRTLVVHFIDHAGENTPQAEVAASGPRFGLVVSKAVGNAVIRHRTSRRLRHICASMVADIPVTADVVIRALPASGAASSADLEKDLRKALAKAVR